MKALVLAGLVSSLFAFAPRAAEACSCIDPTFGFVAPADGATGVPTNTKVWVGGHEVRVLDARTMAEVEGRTSRIGSFSTGLMVFSPDAPLEAGVSYEVVGPAGTTRFTVGAGPDEAPPLPPTITGREHETSGYGGLFGGASSCATDDVELLHLTFEGGEAVTFVDVDRTSDLDPSVPEGGVSVFAYAGAEVSIGHGVCVSNWTFEDDSVGVRLATFDLAGNFSGWSEDSEEARPIGGCTCVAASKPRGGLAGAFALGLIAVSRRAGRRRRR